MTDHLILERHRQFDSEHDGKAWRLKGIFASTRPNANGRTYPRSVLEAAIGKYVEEHVAKGTAFGCLDHPDNAQVSLKDAAVLITSLEWIDDEVHGECTVLNTQQGQELQRILEAGGSVGMSTRGTGAVDRKGNISSDYRLVGIDVVARASAHSARQVAAIYEQEELEEAVPYNATNNAADNLYSRLRRITLRRCKSQTNTNPQLKDKDGENYSPASKTTNPSRRGQQGMKREAQMRLTKGSRYIDPKDDNKGDSANRNPYRPKNKPRFLKPSGSKVKLEAELVESLLQAVTEHHQDGAVFEAAMALGENFLAECSPAPSSTKTKRLMPKNTVKTTPTKTQNNLRRESAEAHVWNRVYGGGGGSAHKAKKEQR